MNFQDKLTVDISLKVLSHMIVGCLVRVHMSEHFVDISCPGPLAPGPSAPAWVQLSVDTHLNLNSENPKAILIQTFKSGRLKKTVVFIQ